MEEDALKKMLETDEQYWARCVKHFEMLLAAGGKTKWRNPSHDNEVRFELPLPPLDAGAVMPIDWAPRTGQLKLRKPPVVRIAVPPAGVLAPSAERSAEQVAKQLATFRARALIFGDAEGCIILPAACTQAIQTTRCDEQGCTNGGGFRCADESHWPRVVVGGLAGGSLTRVSGGEDVAPAPVVSPQLLTAEERLLARAAGLR